MALFQIEGRRALRGLLRAGGRKNSALGVLPAVLLGEAPVRIDNVPLIADVAVMGQMLRSAGASVEADGEHALCIRPAAFGPSPIDAECANRLRASYYLLGACLGRFGQADVPMPGGCDIGARPIDQHLKGFVAMGAEVEVAHGRIRARARRLHGAHIYLDVTSVGASINLMLAAVGAEGTTVIENAAKEPHVVDVATLLLAMGASVVGAGTDVIKIRGRATLHGCQHTLIPDEIEAATYMIAAAGTGGDVVVENVIPRHLEPVAAKLGEAGAEVTVAAESIRVRGPDRCRAANVKTLPYPGFPTDAQQPMTALLATASGTSTVTETIWDSRFRFADELVRMGARIRVEGRVAVVEGVPALGGAPVRATDLRGGAGLILAGLFAEGRTEVDAGDYVDRGYEHMETKLRSLGADIRRVDRVASGPTGSAGAPRSAAGCPPIRESR